MIPATRFVREVGPLTPFNALKPASPFSNSSVAPSSGKAEATPIDRPELLSPSKLRLILLMVEQIEKTQMAMVEAICQRLSTITDEGSEQAREYQQKLKENSERADSGLLWSMLKKVWSAFFSTVTMLFGISSCTSGNVLVGGALIASGILSLTNLVCTEMGIWDEVTKKLAEEDKERQKQISFCIQLTLNIITVGLALFGGIYNMAQTQEFFSKQFSFAVIASLSILNSIVEIGQGITQVRLIYSQADLLKIQTALKSTNIQTKMCSETLGFFYASTRQSFDRLNEIVKMEASTLASIQA